MNIKRVVPPVEPQFTLTFSRHEGWTVLGALRFWAEKHPIAADVAEWRTWAEELDRELRA